MQDRRVQRDPLRRQHAQCVVELQQPGPVDSVHGDGLMRYRLQDLGHRIGHVAARTEFDKDAETVIIHLLDGRGELDRCRPLVNRQPEDRLDGGGQPFAGRARVDGDLGHMPDPMGQELADGGQSLRAPRRVEGPDRRQVDRLHAGLGERPDHFVQNVIGERQGQLPRAGVERDHQTAGETRLQAFDQVGGRVQRDDQPARREILPARQPIQHLEALAHEQDPLVPRLFAIHPRDRQRGEIPAAETGQTIRRDAQLIEKPVDRKVRRMNADERLRENLRGIGRDRFPIAG